MILTEYVKANAVQIELKIISQRKSSKLKLKNWIENLLKIKE